MRHNPSITEHNSPARISPEGEKLVSRLAFTSFALGDEHADPRFYRDSSFQRDAAREQLTSYIASLEQDRKRMTELLNALRKAVNDHGVHYDGSFRYGVNIGLTRLMYERLMGDRALTLHATHAPTSP